MTAQRREVAGQYKSTRAGLIHDVQAFAAGELAAQRLGHRLAATGDNAQVPHVAAPASFAQTDVNAVLVNIQTCKHSGRLTHGSSP